MRNVTLIITKAHENVEKKIAKQAEERAEELGRVGTALLAKEKERSVLDEQAEFKVNETYQLQQRLANMAKRVGDVRHVCGKRAKQLAEILRFDFILFVPTFNFFYSIFTSLLHLFYFCYVALYFSINLRKLVLFSEIRIGKNKSFLVIFNSFVKFRTILLICLSVLNIDIN